MSLSARKWDKNYAQAEASSATPCAWLVQQERRLPAVGRALELACGLGGNAQFLAKRGWRVDAVDVSSVAVEKLGKLAEEKGWAINPVCCDLEAGSGEAAEQRLAAFELWQARYALIVVSAYLFRPLLPVMPAWLMPGGAMLYQTWQVDKPSGLGPSNPNFLLKPDELRGWIRSARPTMRVLEQFESSASTPPDHPLFGQAAIFAERSG